MTLLEVHTYSVALLYFLDRCQILAVLHKLSNCVSNEVTSGCTTVVRYVEFAMGNRMYSSAKQYKLQFWLLANVTVNGQCRPCSGAWLEDNLCNRSLAKSSLHVVCKASKEHGAIVSRHVQLPFT